MLSAVLFVTACRSAAPPTGAPAVIARADLDRDGALSLREYAAVDDAAGFLELDADRDGFVRADELEAWVRLAEPRPEDQVPNPAALMEALAATAEPALPPLAAAAAVVPAKPASRGRPPHPDPSVVVLGGVGLAWALVLWSVFRPLPPEAAA